MVLLGIVDHGAFELGREDIAHHPPREVGLLEDERRGGTLLDASLEHLAELEQVDQLALEIDAFGALGGGADDRSGAFELELGGLLTQPVALLLVEPARNTNALAIRR